MTNKTASQSTINRNNQLVSTYSTQTSGCSQTVAQSTIKCLLLASQAPTNLPADVAPASTYAWSDTPGCEHVTLDAKVWKTLLFIVSFTNLDHNQHRHWQGTLYQAQSPGINSITDLGLQHLLVRVPLTGPTTIQLLSSEPVRLV